MIWLWLGLALADGNLEQQVLTRQPVLTRAGTLHLAGWPDVPADEVAEALWLRLTTMREEPGVRAAVAVAWLKAGADAERLALLWREAGPEVREALLVVGPRHGFAEVLAWGLEDDGVRAAAARGVARFPGAVPPTQLQQWAQDSDPAVREAIGRALTRAAATHPPG